MYKSEKLSNILYFGDENKDQITHINGVNFEFIEDIEAYKNRGWQLNILLCYNDQDQLLGYLKSSYIPKNNFHLTWKERHTCGLNKRNLSGFKNYHVDKPFIDFIRVYESVRNRGLAEKMILEQTGIYNEKNLKFYFSNLNGKEMEGLKSKMLKKYNNGFTKHNSNYIKSKRHYLILKNE